jgi:putative transposase
MALSERRACQIVAVDRATVRYVSKRPADKPLRDARAKIGAWTHDYNHRRPHSALGYATPAAVAANLTATGDRLRNPDQLRQSPVATFAPSGVSTGRTQPAAG